MGPVPSIDELISHYRADGLLAHEDIIRQMAVKIRGLPTDIPAEDIERNVALLGIWPFIERFRLLYEGVSKDLNADDRKKIAELELKAANLLASEDISRVNAQVPSESGLAVQFLNPYEVPKAEILNKVLSVMCEPLSKHVRHTSQGFTKIVHDAQMGGTIYLLGDDKAFPKHGSARYSFLQRSFICIGADGEPVLFMDNIEGGVEHYKHLDHWRGFDERMAVRTDPNRVHHVYAAVAAAMLMAEKLDIGTIVPRDYELVEFGRNLGMRERMVFSKESFPWKIGLHSSKEKTGVYVHSLFRGGVKNRGGTQLRHLVLQPFPYHGSAEMLQRLEEAGRSILELNAGRKSLAPRTSQRLDAFKALYDVINNFRQTPDYRRETARDMVRTVYSIVGKEIPLL